MSHPPIGSLCSLSSFSHNGGFNKKRSLIKRREAVLQASTEPCVPFLIPRPYDKTDDKKPNPTNLSTSTPLLAIFPIVTYRTFTSLYVQKKQVAGEGSLTPGAVISERLVSLKKIVARAYTGRFRRCPVSIDLPGISLLVTGTPPRNGPTCAT